MSWGTKRRNIVLFTLFLFIIIPVGAISFILFYEKYVTNNNTTKKVYINNHTKTKKKQLKVS